MSPAVSGKNKSLPGRENVRKNILSSLLEGMIPALVAALTVKDPWHPPVLVLAGYYTAWRAGRVRPLWFGTGLVLGGLLVAAPLWWWSGRPGTPAVLGYPTAGFAAVWDGPLVALSVLVAYHLFAGAYFFATYYRSPLAWVTTIIMGVLAALVVWWAGTGLVLMMVVPMLWLCLLPLWAPDWRLMHSLLFASIYLAAVYLLARASGDVSLLADRWPDGVAVVGMALLPRWLGYLYPARKHPLDSLPVITPTLNLWQKARAWREVFFLAVDFYALTMEKYTWFSRLAFWGYPFIVLGITGEILISFGHFSSGFSYLTALLLTGGLALQLGKGDYFSIQFLGLYGAALILARCLPAFHWDFKSLVAGVVLLVLSLILWSGRPRETRSERKRWQELNS
ncbi:MAG: hypothetical protein IMW93_01220 [Thermoanaerobacteraceae bacterium]|nr:hypothetical protein [Thermoanaerobacteraceae bacterium]